MKKTEWFPTSVKPVHEGWYEVRYDGRGSIARRWWADGEWWCGMSSLNPAMFGRIFDENDQWRGLAEKP